MKKLIVFEDMDLLGEAQAFFNGDKFICINDLNDSHYRSEYMDPVLKAFGIEVELTTELNKKQKINIKKYLP